MLPLPLSFLVVGACLVACAWTDLRSRRILNAVVLPGALAAALASYQEYGWTAGLLPALYGAGTALLLGVPFYALRALGAGDVKLLVLVGTAAGVAGMLQIAAISIVFAAFGGIVAAVASGRLPLLLANLQHGALALVNRDLGTARDVSTNTACRVPFAVAVAVAAPMWLFFLW